MGIRTISNESFEMLDAIDRRGSFAKAAEELNKATSALSYGVQKLEEQLGITVFVRQGRRSVLTPAGRLLLEEGRVILAATARAAERAKELANGWEPSLRIGVEGTFNQGLLFKTIQEFQQTHPAIELDIQETLLNGSWEALASKKVDMIVGAVGPVPNHQGLTAHSLGHADLTPVISHKHPQAKQVVASGDLENIQLIVTHDTVTTDVARTEGLSLQNQQSLYVQNMEQKIYAVLAGLGAGHLPTHRIRSHLKDGTLLALPNPATQPEQYIAWPITHRGNGLKALASMIIEHPALADKSTAA